MSLRIRIDCDAPPPPEWVAPGNVKIKCVAVVQGADVQIIDDAKADGWTIDAYRALCPWHGGKR